MHAQDLSTPRHQPFISLVVNFWDSFGNLIRGFWPVLLYVFISKRGDSGSNWFFIIGSVGLALMSFVFGILRYYYFTYSIQGDQLIISSGVFTRVHRELPFERIQSVRLEQKLIHRLLNLYAVRFDTAGGSEKNIEIPALDYATAELLKSIISSFNGSNSSVSTSTDIKEKKVHELFALSVQDLFKLGLTANHIRTLFIVSGVVLGILFQLGEVDTQFRFDSLFGLVYNRIGSIALQWAYLFIIPTVLLISVIISLFISIYKYYGLAVYKDDSGYRVNYGLINKQEHFAPFRKIQILRWSISPLRRILGLYHVYIKQASSQELTSSTSVSIPGANRLHVQQFNQEIFSASLPLIYTLKPEEHLIGRYFIFYIIIPAAIMAGVAWYTTLVSWIWIAILYACVGSWAIVRYYRSWHIQLDQETIQLCRGIITNTWDRLFLYKLQGVQLSQTPYQHRHQIANLHLSSAAGELSIPYLKLSDAILLSNFLLYKIESSRRPWM